MRTTVQAQDDPSKLWVFEAAMQLHQSLDLNEVAGRAVSLLFAAMPSDVWALYLRSDENEHLELKNSIKKTDIELPSIAEAVIDGAPAIERCQVRVGANATSSRAALQLSVPLISSGKRFGIMSAIRLQNTAKFETEEIATIELVCRSASVAISNAIEHGCATRRALIDDVTRLYNVRYLYQTLGGEIRRARRYGSAVSVVFMDLDGFKLVNDVHGHRVGSLTLAEVAQVILESVREADFVARYGGDEFVLMLPETGAASAVQVAERVRSNIATHLFGRGLGAEIQITASFGIASFPEHGVDAEKLIELADAAMYEAKQTAKNSVRLAAHGK